MRKMRHLLVAACLAAASFMNAQVGADRSVVAVKSENNSVFLSWRLLATDPQDIGFNIYRSTNAGDAVKLNDKILTLDGGTNYTDSDVDLTQPNEYMVKPVINGEEVSTSAFKSALEESTTPVAGSFTIAASLQSALKATKASNPYVAVPLKSGKTIHFVWVGDLTGDGVLDYVVDRLDYTNGGCKIEAYKSDGTYLWTVDYGTNSTNLDNISPGSASIDVGMWDGVTVGDVNGDGKAEVITKIANGVTFGDGTVWANSSNTKQWIAVLEGSTGKRLKYCAIPTDYLSIGSMPCQLGIGNTNEIFAKFKNRNSDGSFNMMVCCFKMSTSLTLKWKWLRGSTSAADGHQIRIVDLNEDGTDDFVDIGFALNGSNGTMLYNLTSTSGILHGDRLMIGKFDNSLTGLQGYGIQQDNSSGLRDYYYNAKTGAMIWRHYGAVADLARGNAADLDPTYGGYEVWTFDGLYNAKSNTQITTSYPYPVLRMQWDGDILDELYNDGKIENWNYSSKAVERQLTTWKYYGAIGSDRGAPMYLGDIMGDWREEAILTTSDYDSLIIFTTNISTSISRTSFRNDRYYLNCMSTKGYVASSYTSYYMGDQTKSSSNEDPGDTKAPSLAVYPNPTCGTTVDISYVLNIPSEVKLEMYGLAGKLVKVKTLGIREACKNIETVDISDLPSGTYLIKVTSVSQVYCGKLTKL